jgi:hypothetical protein
MTRLIAYQFAAWSVYVVEIAGLSHHHIAGSVLLVRKDFPPYYWFLLHFLL